MAIIKLECQMTMSDEEQFIARLVYTEVTAMQLLEANATNKTNLICFVQTYSSPAVSMALVDLYVSDLGLCLPTGTKFVFTIKDWMPWITIV